MVDEPTHKPKRLETAFMDAMSVLVLCLMGFIVLQVFCSFLDLNPLVSFARKWPFFGQAITLNSLLDLQWHLLAVISLLPAGYVWWIDGHVRVDFLYSNYGPKGRAGADLIGNIVFALPFLIVSIPAAYRFALRSFVSGEGSRNGGLNALFIIKSLLPLGLSVLLVFVALDCWRLLRGAR